MKRALPAVVAAVVVLAAGFAAAAATGGRDAAAASGRLTIKIGITKFARAGKSLAATGSVVAAYSDASGVHSTRDPFRARLVLNRKKTTATTCKVLYLELDKLSLQLLGLDVDLDKVILTINGDSSGGALGSLFCKLASAQLGPGATSAKALNASVAKMNKAVKKSGLTTGIGASVPLSPQTASAAATGPTGATGAVGPCKVLDLVLGPLELDLLGLMVHLDQVHLSITATPGAVLGNLFCSLSGGPTGATTAPSTTTG